MHRDVALVDDTTVVTDEIPADNSFWNGVLGLDGSEYQCFLRQSPFAENWRRLAASATGTRALIRVPSLMCSVC